MKPRICVSLPAQDPSNLLPLIRRAEDSGAELIEIRLDYLSMEASEAMGRLSKVVREASIPIIATNRQYEQGGFRPQNEESRARILVKAAEIGFQYVDIELATEELEPTIERIKGYGAKPIVSSHDFTATPTDSEMKQVIESQIEAGADICKLITTANNNADNIRCLLLTRKMSESTKIVCFAMGRKGALSRAFSPLFGAYFTYASLESGMETALGQMPIAELKGLYRSLGVEE